MRWVVVHYHWRPGGVRRVIETALPAMLARCAKRRQELVLVGGEAPDEEFLSLLKERTEARIRVEVVEALGYVSDDALWGPKRWMGEAYGAAKRVLGGRGEETVVWLHNPAVGRNAVVAPAWARACGEAGARLVCHHHDFFCDWRWHHWPAIRRFGHESVDSALAAMIPEGPQVRHVAINSRDGAWLGGLAPKRVAWLPNPVESALVRSAAGQWADPADFWLAPTRTVRRKNLAEAMLLAKAFGPAGGLVIAMGASSMLEQPYERRLRVAVDSRKERVRWASDRGLTDLAMQRHWRSAAAITVNSLMEGFSLSTVEALGGGRPLILRTYGLPWEDFASLGVSAWNGYGEVEVPVGLFDFKGDHERQQMLVERMQDTLPEGLKVRKKFDQSDLKVSKVAFAHLTLTAQLSILSQSRESLREALRTANPKLAACFARRPEVRSEPVESVLERFSPERFAGRLVDLLDRWDEPWAEPVPVAGAVYERPLYPLLAAPDGG